MSDPYLYSVTNAVATFSINDAPWNLMSVDYIDRLEEQLPDVLADDGIRAMVFTGEGEANFSAGMNLRQIPDGIKRAGSPEAFFGQRHRVLDIIENGGTPAIATLFGFCLGGGLELPLACHFRLAADAGAQIGLPEMDLGAVPAWMALLDCPRYGRRHARHDSAWYQDRWGACNADWFGEQRPIADLKVVLKLGELANLVRQ